ncbi:unnamed protein product [Anisakis simplex]|uniref:Ski_Sno domain-containing protein n=1 Tax=Anisakis simplex TaxID=6269 RepID=A0A0M3KCE8_ANISI|nr:unnamed protein product [Anisakis simplex]
MLALRKHKNGCRQCLSPPFGVPLDHIVKFFHMDTASCALDEFAFIDADEAKTTLTVNEPPHESSANTSNNNNNDSPLLLLEEDGVATKGTDSGLGSEGSNQSCTTSPARSSVHLEDDEGFEPDSKRHNFQSISKIRITLNGTHSASPTSTSMFSSDADSPSQKASLPSTSDTSSGVYNSSHHYDNFVSSTQSQHFTASYSYMNGNATERSTNLPLEVWDSGDFDEAVDCMESTSNLVSTSTALTSSSAIAELSNPMKLSLQTLYDDVSCYQALDLAKSSIMRSVASSLIVAFLCELNSYCKWLSKCDAVGWFLFVCRIE